MGDRGEMSWFEVALWQWWPSLIPTCTARVWAWNAFSAIEGTMRHQDMNYAAYAAAYAEGHVLIYRAHEVWVNLDEEACLPASDEMVCLVQFGHEHR